MALFIETVTKKNSKTYAKSVMFNTRNVVKFWSASDGTTIFRYAESEDRNSPTVDYTTATLRPAFKTKLKAAEAATLDEKYIQLNIKKYEGTSVERNEVFAVNDIVKGINVDTKTCDVWIKEGSFKVAKALTSHQIAEIVNAGSSSRSLSKS